MSDPPQRILIVRPSALGDVARSVPALASLRCAFPDAAIEWLVNEAFADVIVHHPHLSGVVPFPRQRFGRAWQSPAVLGEFLVYLRDLQRRRYDLVYDLQGLGRSGWLAWATRAPRRIGPADARELGWLGYTRRVIIPDTCIHTVDRMLAVLEADGVAPVCDLRLYVGDEERRWAGQWLERNGLAARPYAVIAPTAAWRSKRWPIECFNALAARLSRYGFESCIIVGSASEQDQTRPLLTGGGPQRLDLVGQTSVGQLMAIMERAGVVVANDSAALHIAVGLGRRCVGIFGPSDPRTDGPYRYPVGVVAGPGGSAQTGRLNYRRIATDQSIIGRISLEAVEHTLRQVLEASPPGVGRGSVSEER